MESMLCPSCGSPELTKLNYQVYKCENCGTKSKLSEDQKLLIIQQGYSCSNCGFVNESGTSFCGKCGKNLTKFCESCGEEVRTELDFCPKCGSKSFYQADNSGLFDVIVKPYQGDNKKSVIWNVQITERKSKEDVTYLIEHGGILFCSVSSQQANSKKEYLESLGLSISIRPTKGKIESRVNATGGGCMSVLFVTSLLFLGSVVFLIV